MTPRAAAGLAIAALSLPQGWSTPLQIHKWEWVSWTRGALGQIDAPGLFLTARAAPPGAVEVRCGALSVLCSVEDLARTVRIALFWRAGKDPRALGVAVLGAVLDTDNGPSDVEAVVRQVADALGAWDGA